MKLQTLSDRIMFRAQYRNFGNWQTIVTSHSVDVGNDRAGARWYHMEKQGTGDWGMRDQGTYAPTDGLNRWMPSVAMDKSGDIAVGYSTSNGTAPNYPSIRYATRARDRSARDAWLGRDDHARHRLADRPRKAVGATTR